MKRLLPEIICLVMIAALCFILGMLTGQSQRFNTSTDWSLTNGIAWMKEARSSHQYYIDHPEAIAPLTGSVEFNTMWVNRYEALIKYLEKEK